MKDYQRIIKDDIYGFLVQSLIENNSNYYSSPLGKKNKDLEKICYNIGLDLATHISNTAMHLSDDLENRGDEIRFDRDAFYKGVSTYLGY